MAQTRKLTVTECEKVHEGTNKNGNDYTIYKVSVLAEDGTPIDKKFNSFDDLKIGELIEYEISKRTTEKYGDEFTLKPPKGQSKASGLGASVDELRQRVERLEEQVLGAATPDPTAPVPADPAEPAAPAAPAGASDEELPF